MAGAGAPGGETKGHERWWRVYKPCHGEARVCPRIEWLMSGGTQNSPAGELSSRNQEVGVLEGSFACR